MTSGKRTETATIVGLYQITTSSEPLQVPNLDSLRPGETIEIARDEPLPRVVTWLDNIRANIHAIRSDPKAPQSVKAFAERCSVPATWLGQLLNHMKSENAHTTQFVAQAIEIAAELADEWQSLQVNAALEQPVKKYRNITTGGRKNIKATNEASQAKADETARQKFNDWRHAKTRVGELSRLTLNDQLKKFKAVAKPRRALRERLDKLLVNDRLEK